MPKSQVGPRSVCCTSPVPSRHNFPLAMYITPCYSFAMLRTKQLLIRLTPNEKFTIEQCASMVGLSISSWVRTRLNDAALAEKEAAIARLAEFSELDDLPVIQPEDDIQEEVAE